MKMNSLPYRPCVGLCLFNKNGKVFVAERIDSPGAWQMPQGGIDSGEDVMTAAMRELKEEIGTDRADIIRIHPEIIRYDIPENVRQRIPWGNRFAGQEQTWVALRFTGHETDIVLNDNEHPEFSRYQWVSLSETVNLIVPFKRQTYEKVVSAFRDITG